MKERRYAADYAEDDWRICGFQYLLQIPLLATRSESFDDSIPSWSATRAPNSRRIVVERRAVVGDARYVCAVTIEIPASVAESAFDECLASPSMIRPWADNPRMYVLRDCLSLECDHPSRPAWWAAVMDMCKAGRKGDAAAWNDAWTRLLAVCGAGETRAREVADALNVGSDLADLIAEKELRILCPEPVRLACWYTVSYMLTPEMRPCLARALEAGGLDKKAVRDLVLHGGLARSSPLSSDDVEIPCGSGSSDSKCYLPRPLYDLMALADGETLSPTHLGHNFVTLE
jgi:hypothetical protein